MELTHHYSLTTPAPGMFDKWFALYARYAEEIGLPVNHRTGEAVWRWLLDGTHRVNGIIAHADRTEVAGFAHYRPFPRTLDGNEACFLDDLYVTEPHRGTGLARMMIERVAAIARQRGWTEVRWVTEEHNARARALYEKLAEKSDLVTYRMPTPSR